MEAIQMDDAERRVLALIEGRTREDPITDGKLSELTGIDPREIAAIVKTLLEVHKIPIGASKEKPYGRFIICDLDELRRYKAVLLSTQGSILNRISVLDAAFEEYHFPKRHHSQVELMI